MATVVVFAGPLVCESDFCTGSTFYATWETGEEYVKCPICDNLVKLPAEPTKHANGNCFSCGEPIDHPWHEWGEVNGRQRLVHCRGKGK
jgi:hypothetical protein